MKKIYFLFKKYFLISLKIFISIFFIPFIVLVRLISPIKIIRFGKIRSSEYGHFIGATYAYLIIKGKKNHNFVDFFFFNNFISNEHWAKLLKKKIKINQIIEFFYIANFFIPGFRRHVYSIEDRNQNNEKIFGDYLTNFINKNKKIQINLILDKKNKKQLEIFLKKNNINKNRKFVLISARDKNYKNKINLSENMGLDFSHHDYMNCKINDFIPSIKYLNKLGFLVIRMGKHVEKKIVYKSKLFIDYASSKYRSDFLDLWLKQNCEFAVCSPSGIATPLIIFKKPIIFVNCIPFSNIYDIQNHHFFLPKKIKYKNSSKFISLIKQKKNNFINFKRTENYSENNLLIFDNTKKEIKNTIIDFLSKKSKKTLSKKKKLLNKNFINIANKNSQKKVRANISISFLLHNKWFLKK